MNANETIQDALNPENYPYIYPMPPLPAPMSSSNIDASTVDASLEQDWLLKDEEGGSSPSKSSDHKWHENLALFQHYKQAFTPNDGKEEESESGSSDGTNNGNLKTHPGLPFEDLEANDPKLYRWVQQQRNYALKWEEGISSPMTSDRMDALTSSDFFNTFCNKWERAWKRRYEDYRDHVQSHPNKSKEKVERLLSDALKGWVRRQRHEYAKFENNQKSAITRGRIDKLEALGFLWEGIDDVSCPKFQEKLEDLRIFKRKHGHLLVPKSYPANRPLGRWVARQRIQHHMLQEKPNESCGILSLARIKALDELGFRWTSTSKFAPGVTWEKRFEELKLFVAKNGQISVPKKGEHQILATWIRNQRCFYTAKKRGKKSPLTRERIDKLEALGFKWKLRG